MSCPHCGTENAASAKFCIGCGAPLVRVCSVCGTGNGAAARFCQECGTALVEDAAPATLARAAATSERRLVSILFADLVGFTTLAESRDAEDVRELLSRYFDACRRLIDLYGGTVEKFIGDAVMAVWGTPAATEDDAERAVRTALDLVAAVSALGQEVGAEGLRARAGVMTGETAVTLGAEGQGMVAGDLVNTASRVQALAEPGTVLVGEATRRSSQAAIAYEDAGSHELKGKAEPIRLWRALRVTASRGGALKAEGLEPPFVGRERELRLVKEHFHASAQESTAHIVTVVGVAGIGKSRLAWEFEKYTDGLAEAVWWHRGRCLAYGEGVAYWALAEMLRMRARISDADAPAPALAKLRVTIAEHVRDEDERAWLEPRLAHLLGLTERTAPERADLFSAWRLFFERLSEESPVVLVFEDLQWADAALLDFVEYLLEWSRSHALYVLALARPELSERSPGFGAGSRNATTLALEPLAAPAMEELLDGFVPGLPAGVRGQILDRAEGVPLYAVETVRMLLDRGLLERREDAYRVTGAIEALDVPETLHALIAARLDGLPAEERRVLQDASVLGKSFTRAGLAALSGLREDELEPLVSGLVRKEVLSLQADPRSPERGHYTFLQDLLKRVAYETLARKERKTLHLAAAAYFDQLWGSSEQEVVEVVAAHYLDAYRAAPDAEDAAQIKRIAGERLALAGERAASLAAQDEARKYFEHAAELAEEPLRRAALLERAGQAAGLVGPFETAVDLLERSVALYRAEGVHHAAARVTAWLGWALWFAGDPKGGSELLEEAFDLLADEEPDADLAELGEVRARVRFFLGDVEGAGERIEPSLEIAEALYLPAVLVEALNTKHLVLHATGRDEESIARLQRAVEIGRRHDLAGGLNRALYNYSYQLVAHDEYAEAKRADFECLELSRRMGNRVNEIMAVGHLLASLFLLGEWDEFADRLTEIEAVGPERIALDRLSVGPLLLVHRGDVAGARRILDEFASFRESDDVQARSGYVISAGIVLRAEGKPAEALGHLREALAPENRLAPRHAFTKRALVESVEAALEAADLDAAEELLGEWDGLRPVDRTGFLEAQRLRLGARLALQRGETEPVVPAFRRAATLFRELGVPFYLAVTLVEHGEVLVAQGRNDEAGSLLAEAREIFERLGALPWLERTGRVVAAGPRSEVLA
jgi:class 3 adenylate cyclase/tetratricopeptide (TPR) repeat protein